MAIVYSQACHHMVIRVPGKRRNTCSSQPGTIYVHLVRLGLGRPVQIVCAYIGMNKDAIIHVVGSRSHSRTHTHTLTLAHTHTPANFTSNV
jgi:hypothetical protein